MKKVIVDNSINDSNNSYGEDFDEYYQYEEPSEICPICNLTEISTEDMFDYLIKHSNITISALEKEIQEKFSTHNEFRKFIDDIK